MTNKQRERVERATVRLIEKGGQGVLVPGEYILTATHSSTGLARAVWRWETSTPPTSRAPAESSSARALSPAIRLEALAIRPQDIEAGMLTVARLKGSQRTRQPLLVDLSALIATGSYRVFPRHRSTCFLMFRTAARKVGLHPDLRHPHILRHSMAHWLLNGGVPLPTASQYLGHTSLASTSAYLNVSDAKASAAAAKVIGPILNGEPSAPAEVDKPSDVLASAAAQELVATL